MLAEIEKEKARVDMVRGLLTGPLSSLERVKAQFPEYFAPEDPYEAATTESGEFDIDAVDDSKVDWSTPSSPKDDDDISRWISQQESGSVSAADTDWI